MSQPPLRFAFTGVAAGIKKTGASDLALIVSDRPCSAAATFTRKRSPPRRCCTTGRWWPKTRPACARSRSTAGCANACTGELAW